MGWKYDVMAYKLPYFIGSIWLCVTVWKAATGDWSVAIALGSLITSLTMLSFAIIRDSG